MEILGCVHVSPTWILVAGIVLLIYLYGKRRNRVFKDVGIPGSEPIIYLGNFIEIVRQGVNFEPPGRKKYGDVYGIFLGGVPMVVVHDPDIRREVLIKNFGNFTDRLVLELDDFPINKGLFFQKGEAWHRVRRITSPTFSGAKLRMMSNRINTCAKVLTDNFLSAATSKSDILIKDYFGGYTMDVIGSTAFGIETNSQNEMNSSLMMEAKKVFAGAGINNPVAMVAFIFPGLSPLLKAFGAASFPKKSIKFLEKVIRQMIEQRKAEAGMAEKRMDFLQLMIDAQDDGTIDDVSKSEKPDVKDSKKMTQDEILGQALLFFVAGYETTANTLHFAAYSLATNPDVQQRLMDEIDSVLADREPSYDNIGQLTYLDHVITETLRLFPIVPMLNRKAEKTVVIKGYTIPKDVVINIPTITIHRDPEIYPDPHRFNPDRWERTSEIDPMNYLPFGHGPRHCIGMRLAQVEMKIALAQVLKKIRFVPCEETPAVLKAEDLMVTATFTTKKPLKLRVESR